VNTDWKAVSEILNQLAQALHGAWGCGFPLKGSLPSQATDAACDEWCRKLVRNLPEELSPPKELRPWILARIVVAQSAAETYAVESKIPCQPLTPAFFEMLLVADWHQTYREHWRQALDRGDQQSLNG
jgi:hypothetical protein